MQEKDSKVVFVTVGTTKFDLLVSAITEENVLNALKERGYDSLVIQVGNGFVLPNEDNCSKANIHLSHYKFKNSIHSDILNADLIISHAGAGTCLEVLSENKPLLVVINEELMNNHQTELADQLSKDGYLHACTCATLVEKIKKMDSNSLKRMPPAQPNLFANFLNELMGCTKS